MPCHLTLNCLCMMTCHLVSVCWDHNWSHSWQFSCFHSWKIDSCVNFYQQVLPDRIENHSPTWQVYPQKPKTIHSSRMKSIMWDYECGFMAFIWLFIILGFWMFFTVNVYTSRLQVYTHTTPRLTEHYVYRRGTNRVYLVVLITKTPQYWIHIEIWSYLVAVGL